MNRLTVVSILMLLLTFSSCDFFRKVAGRPTAEELEAKKSEILHNQQVQQARIDSLMKVKQMLADSIAVLDSLREMKGTILNPSSLGGLFSTKLEARYYIIVGAFRSRANAEALLSEASDAGFYPAIVSFKNGLYAVGVAPCNTLSDAFLSLKSVMREDFCPDDAWILVNE